MLAKKTIRKFAFVLPTLNDASAQNEDVVQLLLFAATKLEQEFAKKDQRFSATIISIDQNTSGWKQLSSLFSQEMLPNIGVTELPEPVTPNLAISSHKSAYALFEFLKDHSFDEVHCLDHCGQAYYPTQAKHLGFYFLDTIFSVHVTGGTIFRKEVEDNLLDDVSALMADLLERGSLERTDVIYVHDRKAWQWYQNKIEKRKDVRIYDLAWTQTKSELSESIPTIAEKSHSIIYYGLLGSEGGLPLFCDAFGSALQKINQPVEVFFIGSPRPIGRMDAASYIRLRSAKWSVPVTIKRDLSIDDELAFIADLKGIVVCNTTRRESLRARLISSSGLQVLHIQPEERNGKFRPAFPAQVAETLVKMLANHNIGSDTKLQLQLKKLWQTGRPAIEGYEKIPPSPRLRIPVEHEPKVSVVITHFSRPQKLRTALNSLKQQTYKNFEVIVVDDGSPDPEVKKELAEISKAIALSGWKVVFQENRYLGAARNYGAGYATGEYLLFMDDDNAAKPNEISTLVAVMQRTGVGIVTAFCDVFETEADLTSEAPPAMRFTPFGPDPTLGALSNCFGDANALYSHKIFDQLGGFTEDYGITHEDWEFFCRASLEGIKMVCVPEPLFWYRVDNSAMFRGERTQLHKSANLRRHIRPYLEKLPYYQAKLVQLAQSLTTELPMAIGGKATCEGSPHKLRDCKNRLPYARVAVIMRTKDRPFLLRRAIHSVLNQTFKDWFLVIVNDGGDPETVELVLEEVSAEIIGRVLVINHPISLGMQTASNAGISYCDSDFIIIHDDDDSWEPAFLSRTVSHLDENGWNPKLGGVITWSNVIIEELGEEGKIHIHNSFIFNNKLRNISIVDLAIENRFPPISFLFRRAALEAVGPFREQHGPLGDWDFHLRVLQRYTIDVIPEPLANYHHRTNTTTGIYANSVHAQNEVHNAKRAELINSTARDQIKELNESFFASLLIHGEFQKRLLAAQSHEFQRLHDYIWTIEQRIKWISSQLKSPVSKSSVSKKMVKPRNLISNGDFRIWKGLGKEIKGPGGKYAFAEIVKGFLICYDGHNVSYRIERRNWTKDGQRLAFGKTYLHLENDGQTKDGSWFALECIIPSASQLFGKNICISGISRLRGARNWIMVSGRFNLDENRQLNWPEQKISISSGFARWNCMISCPSIVKMELNSHPNARILLKFPHDLAFDFDLTDFQVEFGNMPTEFEFNKGLSLRRRLFGLWNKSIS